MIYSIPVHFQTQGLWKSATNVLPLYHYFDEKFINIKNLSFDFFLKGSILVY